MTPPSKLALSRELNEQHRQLVLTLHEALVSYDTHNRVEVLEACLWFAGDLGDALWNKLTQPRSSARRAVRECLPDWDHPRLAHFLVRALKHASLRDAAGRVLKRWSTAGQVSALLRQNRELEDPEIQCQLRGIQSPRWFSELDDGLSELDAELRPFAPRWICYAGYSDREKTRLLSSWVNAGDSALHDAVVYMLSRMDYPGSRKLLQEVAVGDSVLASFAGWCTRALDAETVRQALRTNSTKSPPAVVAAEISPAERDEVGADCIKLWLECRRAPARQKGRMIEALRRRACIWSPWLRMYLQSPDPRDRILALQVVGADELARRFADEIKRLEHDPVDEIRESVARIQARRPACSSAGSDDSSERPVARVLSAEQAAYQQDRRELHQALEFLAAGDSADADLVGRLRDLLRDVYAAPNEQKLAGSGD